MVNVLGMHAEAAQEYKHTNSNLRRTHNIHVYTCTHAHNIHISCTHARKCTQTHTDTGTLPVTSNLMATGIHNTPEDWMWKLDCLLKPYQ